MRAFIASLVVAIGVLILAIAGQSRQQVVSGVVTSVQPREWIAVANESTDPAGFQIVVRGDTQYEGLERERPFEGITRGIRVTVWYRTVGERRPVATKVRVLPVDGR